MTRQPLAALALATALLLAPPAPGLAAGPAPAPGPAYLVYAGPYSSSPSSAFGHLFLALARDAADPPPLWRVVTFNAVTFDADPVRYLTVGILGGFPGRTERFAFHEKTRDYELLDDRDLWLVELRLAPGERDALEARLEAGLGRWEPYDFFFHNCAYYLQLALADATGALARPGGVISPAEVFGDVLASRLAGATFHRPSASRRIVAMAEAAAPSTRARLRSEDWAALAADQAWLAGLPGPDRALTLEYFSLRSLQASTLLPPATRDGLARLRLLVAEGGAAPPGAGVEGPGRPIPPPAFHAYPRLRLLSQRPEGHAARLQLRFRAAMHDEADPWLGQQPASTMELLGLAVSTPLDRPAARLDSAVLFSQRSLGASDWTTRRSSWLLEAVSRRGGLFGAGAFHLELRGGMGVTVRLPASTTAWALATVAAVGALDHGAALAPGVEAGLVAFTGARWRLGATWAREADVARWSRQAERLRLWSRLDLGARAGLLLTADLAPGPRTAGLGLDLYL